MEVRTAVTFLRVAELQSFSRAAQQLGYSQAAVTVQIKQLEQELGTQLFERIGRRTKLTEHGAQFVPRAMELVEAARKGDTFLQDQGRAAGSLRIGTAESLFMSTLVPLLPEFHRLCPLVETSVHTGRIADLFDMVRQNDVDLLFFLDKKTDFPEWIKVLERPEPIVFAAPAAIRWPGGGASPSNGYLPNPFCLPKKGSATGMTWSRFWPPAGWQSIPFWKPAIPM